MATETATTTDAETPEGYIGHVVRFDADIFGWLEGTVDSANGNTLTVKTKKGTFLVHWCAALKRK